MTAKTREVQSLVRSALEAVCRPYTEDVILEVCRAIAANSKWRGEYDSLVGLLTVDVVNNWIGRYVISELGWQRDRQVKTSGPLVKSYSKLIP